MVGWHLNRLHRFSISPLQLMCDRWVKTRQSNEKKKAHIFILSSLDAMIETNSLTLALNVVDPSLVFSEDGLGRSLQYAALSKAQTVGTL